MFGIFKRHALNSLLFQCLTHQGDAVLVLCRDAPRHVFGVDPAFLSRFEKLLCHWSVRRVFLRVVGESFSAHPTAHLSAHLSAHHSMQKCHE